MKTALCYALVVLAVQFFCDHCAADTLVGGDAVASVTLVQSDGHYGTVENEDGPSGGVLFNNTTVSGYGSVQATVSAAAVTGGGEGSASSGCTMQGSVYAAGPIPGAVEIGVGAVGLFLSDNDSYIRGPVWASGEGTVSGFLAAGETLQLAMSGSVGTEYGSTWGDGLNPNNGVTTITTPGPFFFSYSTPAIYLGEGNAVFAEYVAQITVSCDISVFGVGSGTTTFDFDPGVSVTGNVPEPSTLTLLVSALLGLAGVVYLRRKAKA